VVNAYAAITYKPLSVSIWGPSNPPAYTTNQTWSAAVSNGTAPYSYTWYRDGIFAGNGASYSEDVYDLPFQLQVIVTDGTGASVTSTLQVSPVVN
jgi:hypothetical protein